MAPIQVHRRGVHTVVEAVQNESSSGEGAIKAPGAGTAVGCGGRDSDREITQNFPQNDFNNGLI